MRNIGKTLRAENAQKLLRQSLVIGTPINVVRLHDKHVFNQKVMGIKTQNHQITASFESN